MINSNVLVLNRLYQPVNVTTVNRAFGLLLQGAARAIDQEYRLFDFDNWTALSAELHADCVRTPNRRIRIPRVIVLIAFDRLPKIRVRFSRHNIYARDGNTCQYCDRTLPRCELNLDHVVPRSRGGKTSWENVVCSCVPCNMHKGVRSPIEAGMRLRRLPVRPRWTSLPRTAIRRAAFREWLPFLSLAGASYWNVELVDE